MNFLIAFLVAHTVQIAAIGTVVTVIAGAEQAAINAIELKRELAK